MYFTMFFIILKHYLSKVLNFLIFFLFFHILPPFL